MKKNILWVMIITCIFLIFYTGGLVSQTPELRYDTRDEAPNLFYDIMTMASEDTGLTTFQFYSKIAYDELQFVKRDNQYYAQYELSVTVFDQHGDQADGRIVRKEIFVNSFEETNSRKKFDVASVTINLKPAKYELLVGIMDFDSRKTGRRKTQLTVPAYFHEPLELSDVILADRIVSDSSGNQEPVPNVMGNYGNQQESLFLWFEVYNLIELDSVKVNYRILNLKDEEIRSYSEYRRLEGDRTQVAVHIPREELSAGKYKLEVWLGKGKTVVKRVRALSVHWMDMPAYANDLDKAIEQLKYIAEGKQMKAMRKASDEKKSELFREFWNEKDPTPGTEQNELMEEYYRRVDYSNAAFTSFIEGWRSDRGMVYIILGAPNDIERHPFEVDSKPYEIWSYYQYNRQFIFVDETGFGDYRLISPFWEILSEIR
ncbi:GWxTD domain-containing protein [bacterium]|nr:GWxTD domain-containing protein [bacterium]